MKKLLLFLTIFSVLNIKSVYKIQLIYKNTKNLEKKFEKKLAAIQNSNENDIYKINKAFVEETNALEQKKGIDIQNLILKRHNALKELQKTMPKPGKTKLTPKIAILYEEYYFNMYKVEEKFTKDVENAMQEFENQNKRIQLLHFIRLKHNELLYNLELEKIINDN